jgi:hypothetical protein
LQKKKIHKVGLKANTIIIHKNSLKSNLKK